MFLSKFSRLCGVTTAAIYQASQRGILDLVMVDGRKQVNLDGERTKAYMTKRGIKVPKTKKKKSKKKEKEKNEEPVSFNLVADCPDNGRPFQPIATDEDVVEKAKEFVIEKTLHKRQVRIQSELKNAKFRGELIEFEMVDVFVGKYLDRLHDNIKRLGNSYLDDVAMRIIKAEAVTNEIRTKWNDAVSGLICDALEEIKEIVKEIQEKQQQ